MCNGGFQDFFTEFGYPMNAGGEKMDFKAIALTAGLGAAAGMVAVLAMPRSNPTRKLAEKAADKVEDIAWKVSDTITDKMDSDL